MERSSRQKLADGPDFPRFFGAKSDLRVGATFDAALSTLELGLGSGSDAMAEVRPDPPGRGSTAGSSKSRDLHFWRQLLTLSLFGSRVCSRILCCRSICRVWDRFSSPGRIPSKNDANYRAKVDVEEVVDEEDELDSALLRPS
jgi:hypothetical protein